jgi:hypothetical protein
MLALLQGSENAARERRNAAGQQVRSKRARAISSFASAENMRPLRCVAQRAMDSRTRSSLMQRTMSSDRVETWNKRYSTLR